MTDLCALLGVDPPQPTRSDTAQNDYAFERHVTKREIDGAESNGWIDLYKRDCFIRLHACSIERGNAVRTRHSEFH